MSTLYNVMAGIAYGLGGYMDRKRELEALEAERRMKEAEHAARLRQWELEARLREEEIARRERESAHQELVQKLDTLSKAKADMFEGLATGLIEHTPQNIKAYEELAKAHSSLVREVTGVELPVYAPKLVTERPDPQYIRAVSDLFRMTDLPTMAQQSGRDVDSLAEELSKTFHLTPTVIKAIGSPGLPPEEKAALGVQQAKIEAEILDNAMDGLQELLKDETVRAWGKQGNEGVAKQKSAIMQILMGRGMDPQEAYEFALALPVFTQELSEKDRAEIRAKYWAERLGFRRAIATATIAAKSRERAAAIHAQGMIKSAQIRAAATTEAARLNAIARVQQSQLQSKRKVDEDVLKARRTIVSAYNALNDVVKADNMTPAQKEQYLKQIDDSMVKIFDNKYNITITPEFSQFCREYAMKAADDPDAWVTLKAKLARQLATQANIKDEATLNYILKSVWQEYGFREAGAEFGKPVTIKTKKQATGKVKK